MSLPSTITFVDSDLNTISDEFYNCGWWIPKDLGPTIADLYSEEEWTFVEAYFNVYDRTGKKVGEFNSGSWYIYDDEDYEIIKFLEEENRKDAARKEIARKLRQAEAIEEIKQAKKEKLEQFKLQGWTQEQIDEYLENERVIKERTQVLIPMIRKIMPETIASSLVGVQPMNPEDMSDAIKIVYREYEEPKKLYFTGDVLRRQLIPNTKVKVLRFIDKDLNDDKIGTITERDGDYIYVELEKSKVVIECYPNELEIMRESETDM